MQNSSLLPKLLAKENVTVRHGNYKTAWFDIKDRVLGLPMWEDMHKDVYDLFVGHEVGHALETPYEGWHDSPEKLEGCPRSYINVVEDARIERKIQARYPGLVGCFHRGYKQLLDKEFFGPLDQVDWEKVKLIDKINLKAKLGTKLEVPFTDEEHVYYKRAMNTSTFEEVLQLVRDILAYTKENTPELIQKPEPLPEPDVEEQDEYMEEQDPTSGGHDDYEDEENESEDTSADGSEELEEDTPEGDIAVKSAQPQYAEDVSVTDVAFREAEKTLVNTEEYESPSYINDVTKSMIDKVVIPYAKLKKARLDSWEIEKQSEYYSNEYSYYGNFNEAEFKQYLKQLKSNVSFAVREFEMRKSAYQYTRAQTAKTGTIDVNKLWSYKTNDDIFLQATRLADAKNHGMMLLIDMSGSMSGSMKYVMDQVLHLITFCKAVNIPFEVYGFTSTNPDLSYDKRMDIYFDGAMELDGLSMPLLCSSDLSKADFLDSMSHIYRRAKECSGYYRLNSYEDWGSTPLNQAITISHHLVKKFKRKHNIEKMNFITFTDGDANHVHRYSHETDANAGKLIRPASGKICMEVDGTKVEGSRWSRSLTTALLKNMKKKYNTNNIGFFMADNAGEWKHRVWNVAEELHEDPYEYRTTAGKEYRKNKCLTANNVFGYHEYYLVKGGSNLDTQEDEFEVAEDASQASIRNAFKKFAKSKKLNKVLMTKFGKAVA